MCAPDSASVASGRVGAHGGCVSLCKRSACTAAPANGRTANESQPSGYTASSPSCPRPESPRSRMWNLIRASLRNCCAPGSRLRLAATYSERNHNATLIAKFACMYLICIKRLVSRESGISTWFYSPAPGGDGICGRLACSWRPLARGGGHPTTWMQVNLWRRLLS